jgi:nucleotide-binding universal stress UspA family protein
MHATDFSPRAHAALRHASELSARLGCPLLIMSCYIVPAYPLPEGALIPTPSTLADDLGRTAKLLDDEKRTAIELGAVDVDTLVVEGVPAAEIVRVARDRFIDMIILGTHGRGALGRALLGSVADKVIRSAGCPVLVVHND